MLPNAHDLQYQSYVGTSEKHGKATSLDSRESCCARPGRRVIPSTDLAMKPETVLVTGGAGFIGSHLVDALLDDGKRVIVIDDMSTGREEWLSTDTEVHAADLTDPAVADEVVTETVETVYHLAAKSDVDDDQPSKQFHTNAQMTYNLVEAAVDTGVSSFVFTSSSTIYGEAPQPTPEDFGPLEPISPYGASKLACEGILSAAAHTSPLSVYNFRFANIVGPRLRGAVIPDFIEKLQQDPTRLEILGDGRQEKSYLHVTDCVEAIRLVTEQLDPSMISLNLGTRTTTAVDRIATIVAEEMNLAPELTYTGGDRGWMGDVPRMRLSIEKLAALGWEPRYESEKAVRRATRELLEEMDVPSTVAEPAN